MLHETIETLVLNTPKNLYLNLSKKILSKIFLPKKSQNQKFLAQKNPSIIPVTWNAEYPPGNIVPNNLQWIWGMQNKFIS